MYPYITLRFREKWLSSLLRPMPLRLWLIHMDVRWTRPVWDGVLLKTPGLSCINKTQWAIVVPQSFIDFISTLKTLGKNEMNNREINIWCNILSVFSVTRVPCNRQIFVSALCGYFVAIIMPNIMADLSFEGV